MHDDTDIRPYSVCSIVRRGIKSKGQTEHSGRGWYEMNHTLTAAELLKAMLAAVVRWQERGLLESVEMSADQDCLRVRFKEITYGGHYRTVQAFANGRLTVSMY